LKRLSLYCLASFWLLCSPALFAQTQGLDFYLYSSDKVRSAENSLQYLFQPFSQTSFSLKGHSSLENRLSFNQESKNADLNLDFSLHQASLTHHFSTDYLSIFDSSDLEPSPYMNKTATLGYLLEFQPLDSLQASIFGRGIIRREQDRYVNNAHLSSDGYALGSDLRWGSALSNTDFGLSGGAQRSRLAWESFDTARMSLYLNHLAELWAFDSFAGYNYRDEDIYILQAPDTAHEISYYQLLDSQLRRNLDVNGTLVLNPLTLLQIELGDAFSQKQTLYASESLRGNTDLYNQLSSRLSYSVLSNLIWDNRFSHSYARKKYKTGTNTRITETRHLGSRLAWEYADYDSLIAMADLDLQIIIFPDDANRWDNDLLTGSYRLGWKHYWDDRIKLNTWLGYGDREDVYLDSLLSANNKQINSFSLLPECHILLGDRLSFAQAYQLRAEYTDYLFDTGKDNTFYRQLGYRYDLIFDTLPLIAREKDPRWLKLPFRNRPHNAFQLDLGYAYEENQYANQKDGYYELYAKNRRWTASLGIRHDIGSFYWTVSPKYSWGTWTEYSGELACAWEFNNGSLIDLSLAPYAENLNNIDWRSSVSLNLRF